MPIVQHVLRRGAVYYWRCRIPPANPGREPGGVLILSLDTKNQDIARRIGTALTQMSEDVFEEIRRGELSPQEARAIMIAVALEQTELLRRAALADRAASVPPPLQGERADRVVGAAYRLVAERGQTASLAKDETDFHLLYTHVIHEWDTDSGLGSMSYRMAQNTTVEDRSSRWLRCFACG